MYVSAAVENQSESVRWAERNRRWCAAAPEYCCFLQVIMTVVCRSRKIGLVAHLPATYGRTSKPTARRGMRHTPRGDTVTSTLDHVPLSKRRRTRGPRRRVGRVVSATHSAVPGSASMPSSAVASTDERPSPQAVVPRSRGSPRVAAQRLQGRCCEPTVCHRKHGEHTPDADPTEIRPGRTPRLHQGGTRSAGRARWPDRARRTLAADS